MNILLKEIQITNFKGIPSLKISFDPKVTNIFGMNGTGKTTIVDSALWTLFNKDSTDRTTFAVKPHDQHGKELHRMDHEVKLLMDVDGQEISIRKLMREKWTTKKGTSTPEFTGHVTEYYWNEVPCNEREYQAKISGLINEAQFKLLTNLSYFNTVLKWEDRRSFLLKLAGGVSDLDFAMECNTNGQYDHLITALKQDKSLEDYRKELAAKRKKIKEDAEGIPFRINEAKRSIGEEVDYSEIEKQLQDLNSEIESVDAILNTKSAAEKKHQDTITGYVTEQGEVKRAIIGREEELRQGLVNGKRDRENSIAEYKRKVSILESEHSDAQRELGRRERAANDLKQSIANAKNKKVAISEEWKAENGRVFSFDESQCNCPTCKQQLPSDEIENMKKDLEANFNKAKALKISDINDRGMRLKGDIERLEKELEVEIAAVGNCESKIMKLSDEISAVKKDIATLEQRHTDLSNTENEQLNTSISTDTVLKNLKVRLNELNELINTPAPQTDNSELIERKRSLQSKVSELQSELGKKEIREKAIARIQELEEQESKFAQAQADVEGLEFSLQEFDRAKMALLEQRVNSKFKMCTFRLFEDQINGGSKPTCVTLINGVPYPDANTASKINASLDIINVFSEHFGVKAPVFIDNRESVVALIDTDMQIVNLFVSATHKKLTVQGVEEPAMAEA